MKKFVLIILFLLTLTLPLNALMPSFGIKGGMNMQIMGNGDSESEWWPAFGGLVELNVPLLPIGFRGDVEYSWHSEDNITTSDMNIILSGKFSIAPPLSPLGFYLGAGPGLHIFKAGDAESENYFGVHVYAGGSLNLGINLFVEGGYGMIFPDVGSWNQVNLKLGLML